jgi:hypothetical protein
MILSSAVAQQFNVAGRVTSASSGRPAEGISVLVKGSKKEPPQIRVEITMYQLIQVRHLFFLELGLQHKN